MKRIKRGILCVALAGVFMLSLLSGCGKQAAGESDATTAAETTTSTSAIDSTATVTSVEPPVTLPVTSAIQAYQMVLQGEAKIYFPQKGLNLTAEDMSLMDYLTEEQFYDSTTMQLTFTVIDMDGDGTPEVIVNMSGFDIRIVLYYDEYIVYGFIFGFREMKDIKLDGSFDWSNSSATDGVRKLQFSRGDYDYINVASWESTDSGETISINGAPASQDEYDSFRATWSQKESVAWYDLSDTNIAAYLR